MIRPRDAVAAFIAECFKRSHPSEKAAAKRLRREALLLICEVKDTSTLDVFKGYLAVSWRVQEIGRTLPPEHREAVLCAVVRELLVEGDNMLVDLDRAIRDACVRHPLDPGAQHHVNAIVRECLAAVEPEARPAEVAA